MGKEFVQKVRVEGSEEAIKALRDMGYQVEELGKDTQQAGQKGQQAASAFSDFSQTEGVMLRVATGAKNMLASFAGMGAILKLYQEFKELLVEIETIQKRFADTAISLSERSKRFAGQTGLGEKESIEFIGGLAQKGGLTDAAAESLGLITDIALSDAGGVKNPVNRALAEMIAPFAAAKSIEGADIEALFRFLKANDKLGSVEEMRTAVSQFVATALASYASNVGGFAGQVNRTVGSLVGAGVSFEDQLRIGTIAIGGAQGNQAEAEEATKTLIAFAGGAEKDAVKLMDAYAKSRGQDPSKLTRGQRIILAFDYLASLDTEAEQKAYFAATSPERASRLFQSFGPLAQAQHSAAAGAFTTATEADYERIVNDFLKTRRYQAESERASQDTADALRGLKIYPYVQAREVARRQLARMKEAGEIGTLDLLIRSDESFVEELMVERYSRAMDELKARGVDVSGAEKLRDSFVRGRSPGLIYGYPDKPLQDFILNVHQTYIGTKFETVDPLVDPLLPLDRND